MSKIIIKTGGHVDRDTLADDALDAGHSDELAMEIGAHHHEFDLEYEFDTETKELRLISIGNETLPTPLTV